MANKKKEKHEQALDLTEEALEALDSGDEERADELIDAARTLDESAVKEVIRDLEEASQADGHDYRALDESDLVGGEVETQEKGRKRR